MWKIFTNFSPLLTRWEIFKLRNFSFYQFGFSHFGLIIFTHLMKNTHNHIVFMYMLKHVVHHSSLQSANLRLSWSSKPLICFWIFSFFVNNFSLFLRWIFSGPSLVPEKKVYITTYKCSVHVYIISPLKFQEILFLTLTVSFWNDYIYHTFLTPSIDDKYL